MDNGEPRCIAFGGLRVDDAIEEALLTVVGPGAIAAAVAAEREASQRLDQVREALKRDLEAARYAADRAFRQYNAADPANRLVAANWKRAGTKHSRAWRRSKAKSPPMMLSRPRLSPIRHRLPRSRRTLINARTMRRSIDIVPGE